MWKEDGFGSSNNPGSFDDSDDSKKIKDVIVDGVASHNAAKRIH